MKINEIYKNGYLLNRRNYFDKTNFNEAKNIIENETENSNLILIIEDQSLESTISIIGSLISMKSILLIDLSYAKLHLKAIINKFKPNYILGSKDSLNFLNLKLDIENKYFSINKLSNKNENLLSKDPLLLLGTSGSSGLTKFVGLSHKNIYSNCISISNYLNNDKDSVSINNLPCSYSYGLSILNTTLYKGGKYVISDKKSILREEFWQNAKHFQITDFSGVPTTYRTLIKLNIEKFLPKSILRVTQAGGKMEIDIQKKILSISNKMGFDFFIMYGQTEATARLTYLNLTKEPNKIGTVGRTIDGVELLEPKYNLENSNEELVFKGDNISKGYFLSKDDFKKGIDQNKGILKTGDIGFIDSDNCITITGRKSRFAKIDGKRISLDAIEIKLLKYYPDIAVVTDDKKIYIALGKLEATQCKDIRKKIVSFLDVNKIRISVIEIEIPLTSNGKISYSILLKNILDKQNE